MSTFTAKTVAQVQAFISVAHGGDTILLAPGTYDGIRLSDINKGSSVVTVKSQDASNPAVLTNFSADKINAINFSNLTFSITSDASMAISNSHVLTFDHIDVHGSLDGDPNNDFRGLLMRNSSYVTVSNSHFHELTDAFNPIGDQNITITGNTFDTLRDDGIAGGGNSQITISNNLFTNFQHTGAVHPDAIQLWTQGTTKAASDITISNNVIDRGTGTPVQGIFLNDEVGNLPFANVKISNNVVLGELYNGIAVYHATNAALSGNVVLGAADQTSWIGLSGVASAQLDDNIATNYNLNGSATNGHGDVLASSLQMQSDGTYLSPLAADSTLAPNVHGMGPRAIKDVMPNVNLLGFVDGDSRFGHSYAFAVVELDGTSGDDKLCVGGTGSYHLYGFDGNDSLVGGRSGMSSTLEGGNGDDSYTIYQANDVVVEAPGGGNDSILSYVNYTLPDNVENMRAMAAGLTLTGNALDNTMTAHANGSTLYGMDGNDLLQGGAGNDSLYGGNGNDRIYGGGGDDYIDGGSGNNVMYGGDGNDTIVGGDGNDTIFGDAGRDILTGGKGADTFVYRNGDFNTSNLAASTDVITDFNAAEGDRISLTGLDANTTHSGSDRFTFIGNQAFHGVAGELRYAADGDGITVYGDTNGDKTPDIAIHLAGLTSITSSSFIL